MRLAFLSDIHANLTAFTAVLADIDDQKVDGVYCLGDIVGYGPEPEAVTTLLRERKIPSLMGNHELALFSRGYYNSLNPTARQSIDLTRNLLSQPAIQFLTSLPPTLTWHGCRGVHGCPPDSITTYLFNPTPPRLHRLFATYPEQLCFFGHTHQLALFRQDHSGAIHSSKELQKGPLTINPGDRVLVNIGSVGQPRDGNNNAKYLLWDQECRRLEIRSIPYDIQTTVRKLTALGFPSFNARRLL